MRALVAVLVVLVAGCAAYAPPPSCDLSANPDLCRLEQRLDRVEYQIRKERRARAARKTCEHAHGDGSRLCN